MVFFLSCTLLGILESNYQPGLGWLLFLRSSDGGLILLSAFFRLVGVCCSMLGMMCELRHRSRFQPQINDWEIYSDQHLKVFEHIQNMFKTFVV